MNDEKIFPDDKVLAGHLGKAKTAWGFFMELLKNDFSYLSSEWRYYNDGKSWLCKVAKKTKTFCWVSVWGNFFKVTCYFNDKAEDIINESSLDISIKEEWLNNQNKSKLRPITIEVRIKSDLKNIIELIRLKEVIK